MNKIIRGKKYSTETATYIGEHEDGLPDIESTYLKEVLYRKKTGEYFIHGVGGADTQYAQFKNGEPVAGETIEPISFEYAKTWAERYLSGDEFEAVFGEVSEDGSTVLVSFSISAKAKQKLAQKSSETGKTQSSIVEELIETLK